MNQINPEQSSASTESGTPTTSPETATHASQARIHQRAYLLQQVMESPEQQLAKGKANRFPRAIARELRLTPTIANELREELVSEGHPHVAAQAVATSDDPAFEIEELIATHGDLRAVGVFHLRSAAGVMQVASQEPVHRGGLFARCIRSESRRAAGTARHARRS